MISKRLVVQKSFRIEANMENDLELLSQKLNRPQNELVNAALNQLMIENAEWFAEDYLIDLCADFLDKKISELEIEISCFKAHFKDTGDRIEYSFDIELSNFTEHCNSACCTNDEIGYTLLRNELKEYAVIIGHESTEIQNYLRNRFDYIYARESVIQRFDRHDLIMRNVGISPNDPEYNMLKPEENHENKNAVSKKNKEE